MNSSAAATAEGGTPAESDAGVCWDRVGVWASTACILHCLAAPFVLLAAPSVAGFWSHPASHALVASFVVPIAFTLARGYRLHRSRWVIASAVLGIGFLLVGSALPYFGGAPAAEGGEVAVCGGCCPTVEVDESGALRAHVPPGSSTTIAGSVFLISAHLGSLFCCRRCKK